MLNKLLSELILKQLYTSLSFFTKPKTPELKAILDKIVENINNYDPVKGVYGTTGPRVFNEVLKGKTIESQRRRYVCIQGAFTDKYFQYLDKPRGKWTHQDPNALIKKDDLSI